MQIWIAANFSFQGFIRNSIQGFFSFSVIPGENSIKEWYIFYIDN